MLIRINQNENFWNFLLFIGTIEVAEDSGVSQTTNLDHIATAEDVRAVKGAVCPWLWHYCPEILLEVLLRQQLSAQMLMLNFLSCLLMSDRLKSYCIQANRFQATDKDPFPVT